MKAYYRYTITFQKIYEYPLFFDLALDRTRCLETEAGKILYIDAITLFIQSGECTIQAHADTLMDLHIDRICGVPWPHYVDASLHEEKTTEELLHEMMQWPKDTGRVLHAFHQKLGTMGDECKR